MESSMLVSYLEPYGFIASDPETWAEAADARTRQPTLSAKFGGHTEKGGHTLYGLECTLSFKSPEETLTWRTERRLQQLREGLHGTVKNELGKSYKDIFADAPFAQRGGFGGTSDRLKKWMDILCDCINGGAAPPALVAQVLLFLDAPAQDAHMRAAEDGNDEEADVEAAAAAADSADQAADAASPTSASASADRQDASPVAASSKSSRGAAESCDTRAEPEEPDSVSFGEGDAGDVGAPVEARVGSAARSNTDDDAATDEVGDRDDKDETSGAAEAAIDEAASLGTASPLPTPSFGATGGAVPSPERASAAAAAADTEDAVEAPTKAGIEFAKTGAKAVERLEAFDERSETPTLGKSGSPLAVGGFRVASAAAVLDAPRPGLPAAEEAKGVDVFGVLEKYGYAPASREDWKSPPNRCPGRPELRLRVDGHTEQGNHTLYRVECYMRARQPRMSIAWTAERQLGPLRTELHDAAKARLGKTYGQSFGDAPFARRGAPAGTTGRLQKWLAALAACINSGAAPPSFVAHVLLFLQPPEPPEPEAAPEKKKAPEPAPAAAPKSHPFLTVPSLSDSALGGSEARGRHDAPSPARSCSDAGVTPSGSAAGGSRASSLERLRFRSRSPRAEGRLDEASDRGRRLGLDSAGSGEEDDEEGAAPHWNAEEKRRAGYVKLQQWFRELRRALEKKVKRDAVRSPRGPASPASSHN